MQSASSARTVTNSSLTGLTYIDTMISGATAQGKFSVVVEGNQITAAGITVLQTAGYTVEQKFMDSMGTYPRYVISWS